MNGKKQADRSNDLLQLHRRAFLQGGSALVGGALLAQVGGAASAQVGGAVTDSIAQTSAGGVRGSFNGHAHVFKGIPYGAPTSGERRFRAPELPASWSGVRDATRLGHQSPQLTRDFMAEELISLDNSPYGEDCLRLNIWTPALRDGGKRPVMVWFHGGGFTGGSGGDIRYDGTNLAERHGVVLVTVNERLNAFGFLYLAELGGEAYADSGNAGLLDLIASLKWVRDNIHEFGGDPNNVTIFGQSGGGSKVSTLMAVPAARGLFHRAICESGLNLQGITTTEATEVARRILDRLELRPSQLDELQRLPLDRILAAMSGIDYASRTAVLRFGPVIDRRTLFDKPFNPLAPTESAQVPMILGSNLTEACFYPTTPRDPIDEQELQERVQRAFGAHPSLSPDEAQQLISLYRQGYPRASNVRLFQILASDSLAVEVRQVAERKAALRAAPAFVYHFEWVTPVEGGRLGAPHTLDIPFVFDNMDVPTVDIVTGSGEDRRQLAHRMSTAWTAFARSGDPNGGALPHWPAYSAERRAVMIFDNECRIAINPHATQHQAIARIQAQTLATRQST